MSVQDLGVALLVVAMMGAVGLQVPLASLRHALAGGRWVAPMLAVNVLLVPAIAVLLTRVASTSPAVTAAVVLCAAAPGGPLGPVLAGLAGADLALATAAMIVLALASVVSTPLVASATLPAPEAGHLGAGPLLVTVVAYQILPLAAGMTIRWRRPAVAARLAPRAGRTANALLVVVVAGLVVTRAPVLASIARGDLAAMAVFVAACVAAGAALGGTPERARALGLCTGVRNLALALLVAAAHLDDPAVDAALLAFGAAMLAGPALVALWWRRGGRYRDGRRESRSQARRVGLHPLWRTGVSPRSRRSSRRATS